MPQGYVQDDPITRIINVNWGGAVIVVFMEGSYTEPKLIGELIPIKSETTLEDKATFLQSWTTPTWSGDTAPMKSSAYKVVTSAGEFMQSIAPEIPGDVNGFFIDAFVFAIEGGDVTASLARAIEGTKLIAPALYLINALVADLPANTAPPGLLWAVVTGDMTAGVARTWKIRHGAHRVSDSPVPPANAMTQCYPLGPSHSGYVADIKVTYSGYFLISYRLDSEGTGQVYSKTPAITDPIGTPHNLPPEWDVLAVTGPYPFNGIPFGDPPPLISADVI